MSSALTRSEVVNHNLTLSQAAMAEIERLRAEGELETGYHIEPRCYVCCEIESRELVNKLIAGGLTNREITETCAGINARRREAGDNRLITAKNVYHHRVMHFNVDYPALAVYRGIVERRAAEANRDHLNGVGHAVTPYAVLETTMVKGYSHITDEETLITTKETIDAATKLHELMSRDAGRQKMDELRATMERIVQAAQEFIDPADRDAFLARIEGRQPPPRTVESVVSTVREFDPGTVKDDDEED
jgi:hypothetical protein